MTGALMGFTTLCRGLWPDCIEYFTLEGNFCRCPQFRNIWTQGQTTSLGAMFPILCVKCMGSFTSPANYLIEDVLYCPRRIQCLIICSCQSKGSTYSSVVLRPWVLVQSRAQTHDLLQGSPLLYNLMRVWIFFAYNFYNFFFSTSTQEILRDWLALFSWGLHHILFDRPAHLRSITATLNITWYQLTFVWLGEG